MTTPTADLVQTCIAQAHVLIRMAKLAQHTLLIARCQSHLRALRRLEEALGEEVTAVAVLSSTDLDTAMRTLFDQNPARRRGELRALGPTPAEARRMLTETVGAINTDRAQHAALGRAGEEGAAQAAVPPLVAEEDLEP